MIGDPTLAPVIRGLREKRDASREDYKGTKVPLGMDDDSRRAWEQAIDMREGPTEDSAAARTRSNIQETAKGMGESAASMYKGLDTMATGILTAPAKYARDPLGEGAKIERAAVELGKGVASGDPESIRDAADIASFGDPTGASDVTSGLASSTLAYTDPDNWGGHLTDASISFGAGAIGFLPLIGAMMPGSGALKQALKAIPPGSNKVLDDTAAELAALEARVATGKVDRMTALKEAGRIEDRFTAKRSEFDAGLSEEDAYALSKAESGGAVDELGFDTRTPRGRAARTELDEADRIIELDRKETEIIRRLDADDGSLQVELRDELKQIDRARRDLANPRPPYGGGGRSVDERLAAEGIPVRMPRGSGKPRTDIDKMRAEISTREAFDRSSGQGGKLFRVETPSGHTYVEASSVDEAIDLMTDGDGFDHYMEAEGIIDMPRVQNKINVDPDAYPNIDPGDDAIRNLISEASPEDSAKYFDLKKGGQGGGGRRRSLEDLEAEEQLRASEYSGSGESNLPEEQLADPEYRARTAKFYQDLEAARAAAKPSGGGASALEPFPEYVPSPAGIMARSALDRSSVSPRFGLSDARHSGLSGPPVVRDLGPLTADDRYLLSKDRRAQGLPEPELRELRDEYAAFGYDDYGDPQKARRADVAKKESVIYPDDSGRFPSGKDYQTTGGTVAAVPGPSNLDIGDIFLVDHPEYGDLHGVMTPTGKVRLFGPDELSEAQELSASGRYIRDRGASRRADVAQAAKERKK